MRAAMTLALLGMATASFSQGLTSLAAHQKVTSIDQVWRVNADASSSLEVTLEQEALSEQGAISIGKASRAYNSDIEKFELLDAQTLKADGRKIQAGPDAVQVQKGFAASGTGASWPGVEIQLVTFPNVQTGDRTVYSYRITSLKPQLPGWARFADVIVPIMAVERGTIRIEAPQTVQLAVSASRLKLVESRSGELEVWTGTFDNFRASNIDASAINLASSFPQVFASTIKDHGDLATLYASQQPDKSVGSAQIKRLATEITRGMDTPADKSKAIFDWVRKNIRYVAVYLGTGGFVAHELPWILQNRYGDCKDHILLMQAMLEAVGIEGVPALISTNSDYVIASLPIMYNHVIMYLPELKLFLDPTEKNTPFGAIPYADADKPVAVALREGGKLMRTPVYDAQGNSVRIKTALKLDSSGKATGTVNFDTLGQAATLLQNRLEQIPASGRDAALSGMLQGKQLRGRGSLTFPAVQRDRLSQSLNAEVQIDNLLNDPQSGSVNPHPALDLPFYVISRIGTYSSGVRRQAYACTPQTVREDFELNFDKAYKILRVPEGMSVEHLDGVRFESAYTRTEGPDGTRIKGYRELIQSQPRHACTPEDYASRLATFNRITRNVRADILFEQP
jgi:transglutaminase-like putative cysteine protease